MRAPSRPMKLVGRGGDRGTEKGEREMRGGRGSAAVRWHAWNLGKSPSFGSSSAFAVVACNAQKVARAAAAAAEPYSHKRNREVGMKSAPAQYPAAKKSLRTCKGDLQSCMYTYSKLIRIEFRQLTVLKLNKVTTEMSGACAVAEKITSGS